MSYERGFVDLPELSPGDTVCVGYISHKNDSPIERTGEVFDIVTNGFRFYHTDPEDLYATSVRQYERRGGVVTVVSTIKRSETTYDGWMHAAHLNRNERFDVDVDVLEVSN